MVYDDGRANATIERMTKIMDSMMVNKKRKRSAPRFALYEDVVLVSANDPPDSRWSKMIATTNSETII